MTKKLEYYFGIVVSGGPAPGINSVINACVIEAHNHGYMSKGLISGFRGVCENTTSALQDLDLKSVSRIYNTGGSILGTSRFNPFSSEQTKTKFISTLEEQRIQKLVVIGGEGSAYLSYLISRNCPKIKVAHVPKTIDNDLILPNKYPSFGFETARYAGTKIIDTLMLEAQTSKRWFLVTSMGRKAGFLALGLGIASGATLSLIPEEFPSLTTPEKVASIIFSTIEKRVRAGKPYGVIIVAEGLLDRFDPTSSPLLISCPRDDLGRIRYSQIELGDVLLPPLQKLYKDAGLETRIYIKNIGYELRCQQPISFDIEYTKFLGFGAVKYLLEGQGGIMVTRDFDNLGNEPLQDLILPDGSIKSRKVDLNSDLYKVARSFMIR